MTIELYLLKFYYCLSIDFTVTVILYNRSSLGIISCSQQCYNPCEYNFMTSGPDSASGSWIDMDGNIARN